MNAIRKSIEELSAAIVLAELSDLQGLAAIYRLFDEIGRYEHPDWPPVMCQAAAASAKLMERIILNEVDDPATALNVLVTCVSSLQACARGGSGEEILFPAELGLDTTVTLHATAICEPVAARQRV